MPVLERVSGALVSGVRVGRYFKSRPNSTVWLWRIDDGSGGGAALIDTGPSNQEREVGDFAKGVRHAFVTHLHEDHAGNVARCVDGWAEHVTMPQASVDRLSLGIPMELYRKFIWSKACGEWEMPRDGGAAIGVQPERGGRLAGQHVVDLFPCPGHSPDHTVAILRDEGLLFSADLFVARKPSACRLSEDLNQEIIDIRNVLALDWDGPLHCGHRGVVPDGRNALKAKADYLEDLRASCIDGLTKGWSIAETSRRLLGREEIIYYFSSGAFSKRNVVDVLTRPWRVAMSHGE